MSRRRTTVLLPTAALLLASACGGGSSSSGGAPAAAPATGAARDDRPVQAGGTLTLALAEDPDALDPTIARTLVGREVFVNMCEKLYDVDAGLELVPQLAQSLPSVSSDGKKVTIKIRSGLKFNDGTALDAEAVKTSLDRHRTLTGSARAADLASVTDVEVVDPGTVRLTMDAPFAPLTAQLADRAGMIMSPTKLEELGEKFGTDPVCVGPFTFASRTPGNEIKLEKAPDYYDADQVKLDSITYRIITDANVRLANVKSKDVQVAERIAATDVGQLEGDPTVKLIGQESLGYQGISINIGNTSGIGEPVGTVDTPLGKNPDLRRAFELSLDRDVINQVVFAGKYTPGCTPLPPVSPYHDASIQCSTRNLEEAKRLVQASGQATVPVELIVGNAPENLRLGQVVQSQAKEAGFDVKVQPSEFASALDQTDTGDYETFQVGWSGRVDPDGNIYSFLHTGGPLNITGASDPQLDKLLEDARTSADEAERRGLYGQALKIAAEDRPIIYLYHPKNYLVTTPEVAGVDYFADGLPRLKTAGLAQ